MKKKIHTAFDLIRLFQKVIGFFEQLFKETDHFLKKSNF